MTNAAKNDILAAGLSILYNYFDNKIYMVNKITFLIQLKFYELNTFYIWQHGEEFCTISWILIK